MGENRDQGLAGSAARGPTGLPLGPRPDGTFISRLGWGRILSQHHLGRWQKLLAYGCVVQGPGPLAAGGTWSLTCGFPQHDCPPHPPMRTVSAHRPVLLLRAFTSLSQAHPDDLAFEELKINWFGNLVTQARSLYCCHVLLAKASPAHPQREEPVQDVGIRGQRSWARLPVLPTTGTLSENSQPNS